MIFAIIDTDSMVVIQTRAGAASAVALGMDESRFAEVAGTLAGDDTIFVAPSKGTTPSKLRKLLESVYGITPRQGGTTPKKQSSPKTK
jgi:transcriptional regulator of arginine metabolism